MKILLVDDDEWLRRTTIRLLFHIGYNDVVEAHGVERALEIFGEIPVDLIITDWSMPGLTGEDLIQVIRSGSENCSVPILLMSGSRLSAQDLKRIGIAPRNYLDKPFGISDLKLRITDLTGPQTPA